MPKKVLVVEDEEIIAFLIRDVVGLAGAEALLAGTSAEASAILESETVDMAIVDYSLPDGNGVAFCQHIDKDHPALTRRCILTSGYNPVGEVGDYLESSGNRFIQKPFPVNALKNLIQEILG